MKAFLGFGFAILLLAACAHEQKTDKPADSATGDGTQLTEERHGDEIVKEYDLNHDKKADVWKYYVVAKDEAGKPVERLTRKEMDLNGDGKIDVWRYYDEKEQLTKEAIDFDFDGKIDEILYYELGQVVRKEKKFDDKHQPHMWTYYEKGKIVRIEKDVKGTGKVDYWEYWEGDQIDRIGEDLNGDGTVDKWTKRAGP